MSGDKFVSKFFAAFAAAVFVLVTARLFDLQVIDGRKYREFVDSQINAGLSVHKNRGRIYDRDGQALAENKSVASVYVFGRNIDDDAAFFKSLARYGVKVDSKTRKALSAKDGFIWIKRGMDLETAKKIAANVPGAEYFTEEGRFYPQGSLMANVLGFTGADNKGRWGIEYALDKELSGRKTVVPSMRDSRGRLILFEDKRDFLEPDARVYLTVSARMQAAAEFLLKRGAEAFGAKNGSAVALNIKTGEILFVANVRSFDPHRYAEYPRENWKNHAFSYVYEPGSIFKTVAFSFLKENGRLNPSRVVDTSKKFSVGGYTYSDTKNYGLLTVDEVYSHSSNIGTAILMKNEGSAPFYSFLENAGFGKKTGIYGVSEESGVLKEPSQWSKTSRTSVAIGYEVMVTPLQMARFYAAVANGGIMTTPRIIKKIVRNGETSVPETESRRIMSEETAEYIMGLMSETVEKGTGVNAGTALTKVAGKTGTASIYDGGSGRYSKRDYSASFAGVFPAENPEIAMVVVYESPTSSIYGGSTAANVFRRIAEFAATEMRCSSSELRVAYADR